jgi:hypothetical protein
VSTQVNFFPNIFTDLQDSLTSSAAGETTHFRIEKARLFLLYSAPIKFFACFREQSFPPSVFEYFNPGRYPLNAAVDAKKADRYRKQKCLESRLIQGAKIINV